VTQWKRKGNDEDELLQSFYCGTEERVNGWKRGNFFYGVLAKMFTPNLKCKNIHHSVPSTFYLTIPFHFLDNLFNWSRITG
jgi:hypothetical protein